MIAFRVCMLVLVAGYIGGHLLDLTATGRPFVQTAFWASRRHTFLAALFAERHLATFAAQDHVAATVDRGAAAQDRAFVQAADLARGKPLLAALFAVLDLAAEPAERNFRIGVMRVRNPRLLRFAAAGKR
jgi:hypothetical protein